jgi:glycosyltransferase involved in cell wall biosynthesis
MNIGFADSSTPLAASVILCTYNPRPDYLALALRSIGAQTLAPDRFEVLLVDNNSDPALDAVRMTRIAGIPVRIVKEPQQGLTHARVAGIHASSSDVIVFVDDDNELAPDYLERAVELAQAHPQVGTFGGVTHGILERSISRWKHSFLPQLGVRNYGAERIEGPGSHWGEWEPIGAGMVVRRVIATEFARFVAAQGSAGSLGEDSLFSRLAFRLGLNGAYEPSLRLKHYIAASRLTARYLAKLAYGHGRSYVLLSQLTGEDVSFEAPRSRHRHLLGNFRHRLRTESFVHALGMYYWDRGYLDAVNEI